MDCLGTFFTRLPKDLRENIHFYHFTVLPSYPFLLFYPFTVLPFYPFTARLGGQDLLPFYRFTLLPRTVISRKHRSPKTRREPPQHSLVWSVFGLCFCCCCIAKAFLFLFHFACSGPQAYFSAADLEIFFLRFFIVFLF